MIFLGFYAAGATVKYRANFHNDTGTLENPTAPEAQREDPSGTFTNLTAPAILNAKTGHFGGSIDTTGFAVGQHFIRMAGTVTTGKVVATEFCFEIVAFNPLVATAGGLPIVGTGANNFKSDASANVTFANTSIASVTNDVGITQAAADKAWGTATRTLTGTQTFNNTGTWTGNLTGSVGSVTAAVTVGTINANVINAASINAAALNGKGDWNIGKTGYTLIQAFPTNFAAMGISVGGVINADAVAISGDTPAADNLEAMFDGTGYANQFAPSTQQQVDALSAGVAAINVAASGFTLNTGTQVNTFTATVSLGGLSHELSDTAGTFDGFYEFDIGPIGIPVNLSAILRVFSSNDIWFVQGFNWSLSQWENIRQIDGKNQTTFDTFSITLFQRFAGTGANLGKVRIRMFTDTGTTSTMFVDQLAMAYIQVVNDITRAGLAQGGGASFIDLDAGASSIDDFYRPSLVRITAGTGAIQVRRADSYNGTTKRLTVATPWATAPDGTSQFEIRPWASVRVSDVDDPAADGLATRHLDLVDGVEAGFTVRQVMRVIAAAMGGKSSQHNLGTPKYRNLGDTKDRISAVTDVAGNRNSVTLDTS